MQPILQNLHSMDAPTSPAKTPARNLNVVGYLAFTIAGIVFSFIGEDRTQGPIFLCLALICDPYDPQVKWGDRPLWVRSLPIIHLGVSAALLGYLFSQ